MTMPTLRDYQLDVIERGVARFKAGAKRLLIQAPTGAGKTHISSEIVRRAVSKGKRVLFLAHRRRLIEQKSERLTMFGVDHGIIMNGCSMRPSALVQVASRDTLFSRAIRNDWMQLPKPDLVIVDEARNAASGQYLDLLQRFGDTYFVGLDATPARSDGSGLGDFYQALECTVPVSQLIREGWLVPLRCYAPDHKAEGGKRELSGDPVKAWKDYGDGRPTVLFAGKVAESRAIEEAFKRAGIPAAHIDAHTSDEDRDAVIAGVERGRIKVVCNVGIWTEGVDIPALSCCQLVRLAGSYVLFMQAVGRVIRSHPGKEDAVLIDHSGAVFEHGFPDEDVEWSLNESESVDERIAKDKEKGKRKEPIVCPVCGFMFAGSLVCPACKHILPPPKVRPERKDALLVEVERGLSDEAKQDIRVRYWRRCLGMAANKGRTVGAAAQMFQQRFGVMPWNVHGLPHLPKPGPDWKRKVSELYPQYVRSIEREPEWGQVA